jgi:hypothetical protein
VNEIDNIITAVYAAYMEFEKRVKADKEVVTVVGNAVRFLAADLESAKGLMAPAGR